METVVKKNKKYRKVNMTEWRGLEFEYKKYSLLLEDEENNRKENKAYKANLRDKLAFYRNVYHENIVHRQYMHIEA